MADQLPDPALISQALDTTSSKCAKLTNLFPAFNQGAAIPQALATMNQHLGQMERRMDMRFDSLEVQLRAMSTFLSSIPRNQNSIAQTQNSMRDFSDQALVLLVNAITADDIPGFPANPSALNHASAATINHLFEALGLRGFGIWVEKRRRIAAAIGLKD